MRTVLLVIAGIISMFALVFLANEFEIFGVKFWSVRKANAQREVFEQTQSYIEGKRQELVKLHYEWLKAPKEDKAAIEATIRMSFANFDDSKLVDMPELYHFLIETKYGK